METISDVVVGIVRSGILSSKKTWASLFGIVSAGLVTAFGVGLSETTQMASVAFFSVVVLGIGLEDFLVGKIPYVELEHRLSNLFTRREFIAALLGTVALYIQDLGGVEVNPDVLNSLVVLWLFLVSSSATQTAAQNYSEAKKVGVTSG